MVTLPNGSSNGPEAESDIEGFCQELLQATSDLAGLLNPYRPYRGSVLKGCIDVRNRVNHFLHKKEEEAQDYMGKIISLGGGQVGLSADKKAELELHLRIFSRVYNYYLELYPDAPKAGAYGNHPEHRWTWMDQHELLNRSTLKNPGVFADAAGRFSHERGLIHECILRYQSRFGLPVDMDCKPTAVLLVGGSPPDHYAFASSLQEEQGNFVEVNPEEIAWQLPEFQHALSLHRKPSGAMEAARNAYEICKDEALLLATQLLHDAQAARQNVLLSRMEIGPKEVMALQKTLSRMGFHVQLVVIDESLDTLLDRSRLHAVWTGTYTPEAAITQWFEKAQKWLPLLCEKSPRVLLYSFERLVPELVWVKEAKKSETLSVGYLQSKGWTLDG